MADVVKEALKKAQPAINMGGMHGNSRRREREFVLKFLKHIRDNGPDEAMETEGLGLWPEGIFQHDEADLLDHLIERLQTQSEEN